VILVVLTLSGLIGACSSDASLTSFGVDNAWSRATPTGAVNGVVYMTVTTDEDDVLVEATAPSSVARKAELHSSMLHQAPGSGHHGRGTVSGEAVQVDEFPVNAGTPLEFRPGGNHVMLIDLGGPLVLGMSFPLTLRFESGRTYTVNVVVANNQPE
jgi:hypothetical protein